MFESQEIIKNRFLRQANVGGFENEEGGEKNEERIDESSIEMSLMETELVNSSMWNLEFVLGF